MNYLVVANFYRRMIRENGPDAAMAYTLEQFEGLTDGQVNYALREQGRIDTAAQKMEMNLARQGILHG